MRTFAMLQTRVFRFFPLHCVMLSAGLLATTLFSGSPVAAQAPASVPAAKPAPQSVKSHSRRPVKKEKPAPEQVAQTPPPPPTPDWPVNDKPNPASVVWDATGLRINASNSSLQQILNEVATETGSKVEGPVPDQRIYGNYGPGQARDVLAQLLQGSGENVLLAGDIGQGAPREIVLSPRLANGSSPNGVNRPQQDPDEDIPEQPEDQVQQPAPAPQIQNMRPGFGPNGPVRTPQQVMEEMQQRQQQQQLQQQQQANPTTNPQ
jgi:hypothetical protein